MFNIILTLIITLGIVTWITIKLKNWTRRFMFFALIFIITPLTLYWWFEWGYHDREQKLKEAQASCRQQTTIKQLRITFSGFEKKDILHNFLTVRKNPNGKVLDSGRQHVKTGKYYNGLLSINYTYEQDFRANDIIEISIGDKKYTLSNFVQTAIGNYNMGGPVIGGCRIDSADINGKRTALDANIFIHKTDLKKYRLQEQ